MFNLDEEWIDAKIILSYCNKPFFHLSHRHGLELVVDLVGYKKDLYDMVSTGTCVQNTQTGLASFRNRYYDHMIKVVKLIWFYVPTLFLPVPM